MLYEGKLGRFCALLAVLVFAGMFSWVARADVLLAYTPPVAVVGSSSWIGVPNPDWGATIGNPIDYTCGPRPAPWTSGQEGYYYVNDATGSDSGNPYGYPSAPRDTLPAPIPAGSYVEVHGTYSNTVGGTIRINAAGTSTDPVCVVGLEGQEPTFTVTNNKTIVHGDYLIIDNVIFGQDGNKGVQIGSDPTLPADYIMIRNSEVDGDPTVSGTAFGIDSGGAASDPSTATVLYNNYIHNIGPATDTDDSDAHMINSASNTDSIWILNNTLSTSIGSGIVLGGNSSQISNAYVAGNSVTASRQSGIWVKGCSDCVISQNTVTNVGDRCFNWEQGSSPSKGLGGQYVIDEVWYIFNWVEGNRYGLRFAGTSPGNAGTAYVVGNVFVDNNRTEGTCFDAYNGTDVARGPVAVHVDGANDVRYFVDNTLYNNNSGMQLESGDDDNVTGNIVVNTNNALGKDFWIEAASVTEIDYNHHYNASGNEYRWGTTNYATLPAFHTATSESPNSQSGDPLFTNAAGDDFTLQSGSPAIDQNKESPIYDKFFTDFGISIEVDYNGDPRNVGGGWDMGAFERQ